ncbi:MAG: VTT domain-containing protein, partial [Acidobacteriota bacterium]
SAVALIVAYFTLAPLGAPMTPLVIGGAIVFGSILGAFYNILGLVLGAMSAFFVAKALGRELIVQLTGPRLRRAERIFERRGFWPLVHTRFLPIPFSVVSYGAALAGVTAPRFFITSTLGLIPATAMHSYFMAELYRRPSSSTFALYLAIFAVFNLLVGWPTLREGLRRRQRYRELQAKRQQRSAG